MIYYYRYLHIQTSAIKRKYPILIVRIFLFQCLHIQYRDIFIYSLHFGSKVKCPEISTAWNTTCSREGRVIHACNFCQSPKGVGDQEVFKFNTREGQLFFWKKRPKSPSRPHPRKDVPSLNGHPRPPWRKPSHFLLFNQLNMVAPHFHLTACCFKKHNILIQ